MEPGKAVANPLARTELNASLGQENGPRDPLLPFALHKRSKFESDLKTCAHLNVRKLACACQVPQAAGAHVT